MKSWIGLWKKEMRLMKPIFTAGLLLIALVLSITLIVPLVRGTDPINASAILLGAGIFTQFAYIPVFFIISFYRENRHLEVWLHTPQSILKLLSAKIASALACGAVTLLVNGVLFLIFFGLAVPEQVRFPSIGELLTASLLGALTILFFSLMIGMFVILFFSLYLVIKPYAGKWFSILIVFVLVIGGSWIYTKFSNSGVYETLTMWGEISVNFQTGVLGQIAAQAPYSFYTGTFVYGIVEALIVLVIASFLLEKRVEV
ncbi:hypothetical protein ATL39_1674 [Sinobaca qinghaiensis]|uniref:ABC-2 type transport system permease protein n=1 Tax=Sinobaca qinghaiensis TaxID=342944 RepID=A0A419V4L1_9BACL|nr:hypothetical protein [Sinobaca qinghaiensis]RKD73381.1 hypothetical protein ATL39_1674 [Sinobaca qinghaiensis]